jgi:hypothetical protein
MQELSNSIKAPNLRIKVSEGEEVQAKEYIIYSIK